jgi:capsular polysaccharide biosynthesis protein
MPAAATRAPSPSRAPRILFVLRRESRVIVNEAALQAAVTAEAGLEDVIQFVRMEDVGPLVAQIALIARASAIAGMHGQGLALVPLLPAHERPCALLELRSKRMGRQATHAGFDLMRWAMMSGVRYFVLKHQPDTAPCLEEDFRLCGNVTVNVPEVVEALHKMRRHIHEIVRSAEV